VVKVADFIFLGFKTFVDGYHSHEIKRYLLLGRKAMTSLESTLKSRDITLSTKIHIVKAMFFSSESALHIRWPNIGAPASASVLPMNIQC